MEASGFFAAGKTEPIANANNVLACFKGWRKHAAESLCGGVDSIRLKKKNEVKIDHHLPKFPQKMCNLLWKMSFPINFKPSATCEDVKTRKIRSNPPAASLEVRSDPPSPFWNFSLTKKWQKNSRVEVLAKLNLKVSELKVGFFWFVLEKLGDWQRINVETGFSRNFCVR